MSGPAVDPDTGGITFRVDPLPDGRPLRVWFHLRDFGADPAFHEEGGWWVARIPRPPVHRLEYLLEVGWASGERALVCDPGNPRRVPGVFGDKSLVELPGYAPPWWLDGPDPGSRQDDWTVVRDAEIAARPLRDARRARWARRFPAEPASTAPGADGVRSVRDPQADVAALGQLLAPSGSSPDEPLPLLAVHDGPEYAQLAALLRYLSVLHRADPQLRCRVLLLRPVDRDRSYSASPGYARALAAGLLPDVASSVAIRGRVVGVGASLGALAILHAALNHPGIFGAVLCQSGSFFRPDTDDMESGYRWFGRITDFVASVDADPARLTGLRVALTCGTGEDNLANNRLLARRLRRAGVPTTLTENRDGHSYGGWRDSLDPALADLLRGA